MSGDSWDLPALAKSLVPRWLGGLLNSASSSSILPSRASSMRLLNRALGAIAHLALLRSSSLRELAVTLADQRGPLEGSGGTGGGLCLQVFHHHDAKRSIMMPTVSKKVNHDAKSVKKVNHDGMFTLS